MIGPNYLDWFQILRIVFNFKKINYVLNQTPFTSVAEDAIEEGMAKWQKWNDDLQGRCYIYDGIYVQWASETA